MVQPKTREAKKWKRKITKNESHSTSIILEDEAKMRIFLCLFNGCIGYIGYISYISLLDKVIQYVEPAVEPFKII